MKKYIALACLFAFTMSFSACGTPPAAPGTDGQSSQGEQSQAEQTPQWTQEDFESFINRDSSVEMSYAGPFYFGSYDGRDANSKKYSEQRREKVDEVLEVIDEGVEVMVQLDKKLREEREVFDWYIKGIQEIDTSTKTYTDQVLGATKGNVLSEALSELIVVRNNLKKQELSPEWGFMQFQSYGQWIELATLYSAEAASLMSRMTAMYYLLEADPNTAYQDLNRQFLEKMDPVSEEVSGLLGDLYRYTALANYGEKLLFTADYYFAKDTIAAIDKEIAKADKSISEYQGGNEFLDDATVELLKKKLQDMKDFRDVMTAYLDSIPAEELIAKEELAMASPGVLNLIVPVAYAQMDIPGWFQQKVKDVIKTAKFAKDMSFAAVRVTGQKIKDVYDKSGAHEVVKDGAQIVNAGLEGVNSSVEVAIYGIQGLYFGDMSYADFKKKIENEKNELYDKFVKGTLGKEQYDEMIHQLDQFKKNTDTFVKNMSEFAGDMTGIIVGQPKVGKFVKDVTKAVGNEVKAPLDTATEFSKNIAIVMHPETSKEDTRNALLGIYEALKGIRDDEGKLIELEVPDFIELAKEKGWEQAVNDLGLSEDEEKELIDQLKDTFMEQLKDKETPDDKKPDDTKTDDTKTGDTKTGTEKTTADSDKAAETAADRVIDEMQKNPDMTDEEFAELIIKEALKGLPPAGKKDETKEEENKDVDNDGVENEYDNCEKVANSEQTDTDMDSLGDACDPDCSGDSDQDLVCDEVDNCPNDPNGDQSDVDNDGIGNVCDEDAPLLSEIAGTWPGTITVTEVYISDELRAQAEAEGCDISELESSKDVPKPVAVTINPTSETGGNIVLSGADDGGDQNIPFTYENGILKAVQADENASINIEMNFSRNTSNGKFDLDYLGGNAKVQADLDLKK